jgi:hypothetical protein
VAATVTRNQESRNVPADAVIEELWKAIESLKYGTIAIKVHNGKITQMEVTEKRRFDVPTEFAKGGGI